MVYPWSPPRFAETLTMPTTELSLATWLTIECRSEKVVCYAGFFSKRALTACLK